MNKIVLASATLLLVVPVSQRALAQWIVSDPATEESTAATATSTGQIAGSTSSLVEPTQQTQTNTSNTATNTSNTATNTLNIENTLKNVPQTSGDFPSDPDAAANDSIVNPMPTYQNVASALSTTTLNTGSAGIQMGGGDNTLSTEATTLYGQNPATNPGSDPVLDAQDAVLRVSSNIQGMAVDNLQQLQARLAQINDLLNALGQAKDITTVETINARLSIAAVTVQAQQAQAANLAAIATAQSEINRENEAQAMRNEHLKTALLFTAYAQNPSTISSPTP